MSPRDKALRKPVALLDLSQDAIDRATARRLELANFCVVTDTAQDPADPIDVAVIRPRPVGADEACAVAALAAALSLTRAAVAAMSQKGGQIIYVVSSIGRYRSAWFRGQAETGSLVAQAAIEGALIGQTRQLAFELAPRRVRVNAVAYGWIGGINPQPDEMLSEQERATLLAEISLRRPGEPDEVAGVIEFLAKPASSYITGTVLEVNGGWWMS